VRVVRAASLKLAQHLRVCGPIYIGSFARNGVCHVHLAVCVAAVHRHRGGIDHDGVPGCLPSPHPHVGAGLAARAAGPIARAAGLAALATLARSRRPLPPLPPMCVPPASPPVPTALPLLPPSRLAAALAACAVKLVTCAAGLTGLAALARSRRARRPQHEQCRRRRRRARPSPWSPHPRSSKLHITLRLPTSRWRPNSSTAVRSQPVREHNDTGKPRADNPPTRARHGVNRP